MQGPGGAPHFLPSGNSASILVWQVPGLLTLQGSLEGRTELRRVQRIRPTLLLCLPGQTQEAGRTRLEQALSSHLCNTSAFVVLFSHLLRLSFREGARD